MEGNNKHIKNYSATDIQQYLQGKLSDHAMHDLEKAALEDPFLSDAIEGMQQQEPAVFRTGIQELTKRLKNRTADQNRDKPFFLLPRNSWWKAAAIVLVIAGAGGPLYLLLSRNGNTKNNIAATKQEAIGDAALLKSDSSAYPAGQVKPIPGVAANEQPVQAIDKVIKRKNLTAEKDKAVADRLTTIRQALPANQSPVSGDTVFVKAGLINSRADSIAPSIASGSATAVPSALTGKLAGVEVSRQRGGNPANLFEGILLDEYKKPIQGATVKVKNRKTATVTDSYGQFKLNTGSKDSLVNVVVHAPGFQPASFMLKHADTAANTIQLQSNASALNEVVVVGYGVQRKRALTAEDSTALDSLQLRQQAEPEVQAMPVIGWEEYNTYLDKNKKIATADSTRKGKEIISFLLDQKGKRSDFKVKRSLSPAHDTEAIRLVKEGPAWQLLSAKKARIKVTIEF